MASPFPGMDPFIEGQRWRDFHTTVITVVREILAPQVRPRYVVEVEEYVYLARGEEDPDRLIEPVIHTVPVPTRYRQAFLSIRDRQWHDVVAVIELLSPVNKKRGEGRNEYLVKRSNVFHTPAHLVEIDLLRGGERLPTREPLEPADFYAFVCRTERLPQVEV